MFLFGNPPSPLPCFVPCFVLCFVLLFRVAPFLIGFTAPFCVTRFRNSRKSKKTKSLLSALFKDSRELKNPDFSRLFSQQRREKNAKKEISTVPTPEKTGENEKIKISTVFPLKKDGRKSQKTKSLLSLKTRDSRDLKKVDFLLSRTL